MFKSPASILLSFNYIFKISPEGDGMCQTKACGYAGIHGGKIAGARSVFKHGLGLCDLSFYELGFMFINKLVKIHLTLHFLADMYLILIEIRFTYTNMNISGPATLTTGSILLIAISGNFNFQQTSQHIFYNKLNTTYKLQSFTI